MDWNSQNSYRSSNAPSSNTRFMFRRSAFTIIDLMVSMAVISLLIAITLPALSTVRESARKTICSSNLRQLGLGMSVFSQDHKDRIPESVFLPPLHANGFVAPSSHRMDTVRLSGKEYSGFTNDELWDGIGMLYQQGYVSAPGVYYCPSHKGSFAFEGAAEAWNQNNDDEIVANYLYRGTGPDGSRVLYNIEPAAALVSDTLRSYRDLNHEGGVNILQAGLAVNWINDFGNQISQGLLLRVGDDDDSLNENLSETVTQTWDFLDRISFGQLKDINED